MGPSGTDAGLETAKLRAEQMALQEVQMGAHPHRALWVSQGQQEKVL